MTENIEPGEDRTVIKQVGGFCVVQRVIAQALRKHGEALGLYTFLLSLPDKWEFKKSWLEKQTGIGKNKLNRLLNLLSKHNLVKTIQRKVKGKFAEFDMEIYDGKDFKILELEPLFSSPWHRYRATETVATEKGNKILDIERTENKIKTYCSSSDERENGFIDFWSIYPKKVGKVAARKAWKAKKLSKDTAKIVSVLRKQLETTYKGKEKQFIPNPATYLNGEKWNDEIINTNGKVNNGRKESISEKSWCLLKESHAKDIINEQRTRENATDELDNSDICPFSRVLVQ